MTTGSRFIYDSTLTGYIYIQFLMIVTLALLTILLLLYKKTNALSLIFIFVITINLMKISETPTCHRSLFRERYFLKFSISTK